MIHGLGLRGRLLNKGMTGPRKGITGLDVPTLCCPHIVKLRGRHIHFIGEGHAPNTGQLTHITGVKALSLDQSVINTNRLCGPGLKAPPFTLGSPLLNHVGHRI